jgi:hypothetical protein
LPFSGKPARKPSGLKIVIDELSTIQSWDRGAVLHYRETQTRPDLPVNVRWSTAVLNQEGDRMASAARNGAAVAQKKKARLTTGLF